MDALYDSLLHLPRDVLTVIGARADICKLVSKKLSEGCVEAGEEERFRKALSDLQDGHHKSMVKFS